MFIESDTHVYYNFNYVKKIYRYINEIRLVLDDGEDVCLYTLKNIDEVSRIMVILRRILRSRHVVAEAPSILAYLYDKDIDEMDK